MGVLYLVRHGQAPTHAYGVGTAPDPDTESLQSGLTDLGHRQAAATGALLAGQVDGFAAAVSGDLPRQRSTLNTLVGELPEVVTPTVDPRWNEYEVTDVMGPGDSSLYSDPARYQRVLDEALTAWAAGGSSGGESYREFAERVREAAYDAARCAGAGQSALVVSSAGTITQLIAQLWEVPPVQWPVLAKTFVNASVSTLIVGRRGLTVVSVNEQLHLRELRTFR